MHGVEMLPIEQWPPAHAELVCEFIVIGEPKPAGSKVSGVATRVNEQGNRVPVIGDNGMPKTFTKDSSGAPGKAWRQEVASAGMAYRRVDAPLTGRLAAEFVFVTPYKAADYSKRNLGQLRDSVRVAPHVRPDALKLGRAVEDALATVLYEDDAQITEERLRKVHVNPSDGPQRCEVRLWTLPTTWGDLRAAEEALTAARQALFAEALAG